MTATAFFGTPEAALPTLERLHRSTDVRRVVTRPPRPRGRGRTPTPSPVGRRAAELGLPVLTPVDRGELAAVALDDVDVAVVVAYGAIIPGPLLDVPRRGFLNVHFSLLPRWRGAAPVERALLAGDDPVGVTIMAMDEGLDTGPIVAAATTHPGRADAGRLTERLAEMGAELLVGVLDDWVAGRIEARAQPGGATTAPKLAKEEGRLDPSTSAVDLDRRVRALTPRPGTWVETDHGRLGILTAEAGPGDRPVGELAVVDDRLELGTIDGVLHLDEVQPAGRRPMTGSAWARGRQGPLGRVG